MATQRSKAELLAFFVENVSGSITPSMLRDLVESCVPATAAMHLDDPGTPTVIATPSTFVKAANSTSLHGAYRFSHSTNRLTYVGPSTVSALLIATLSFTSAVDNQVLNFAFAINGVPSVTSSVRAKTLTGTNIQAVTLTDHATLAPNDYAEIWVSNDTSASNLTIVHGHVSAMTFLT